MEAAKPWTPPAANAPVATARKTDWGRALPFGIGASAAVTHAGLDVGQVGLDAAVVAVLDQGDAQGILLHASRPSGSCMVTQCRLPFCQISGRQFTGTISRPGKASASTWAAAPSAASP